MQQLINSVLHAPSIPRVKCELSVESEAKSISVVMEVYQGHDLMILEMTPKQAFMLASALFKAIYKRGV